MLAVDPEGLAESAVPIVAALARKSGGQVYVVGVTDGDDPSQRRAAVEDHVRRATEELTAAGLAVQGEVRHAPAGSSAAAEIVTAARARGADLVALGSHGHGSVAALVLGSTGRRVAAEIEAPILLVHGAGPIQATASLVPAPIRRILVPVDYSEASRHAVDVARAIARDGGATVMVFHAREMVPWGDAPYVESSEEAQQLLQEMADRLRASGCAVETRITEPMLSPVSSITKAAEEWNADLIVVGSRRLTALGGLLLGSVTQGVVNQTTRPVLVAGHPVHDPLRGAQSPSSN